MNMQAEKLARELVAYLWNEFNSSDGTLIRFARSLGDALDADPRTASLAMGLKLSDLPETLPRETVFTYLKHIQLLSDELDRVEEESEVAQDRMSTMQDDMAELLRVSGLGSHARPASPHEVMVREIIPRVDLLFRHTTLSWGDGDAQGNH